MYSFRCSYVLQTFLLFPVLLFKKEMEKQKFFVQDKTERQYIRQKQLQVL